MKVALIQMDIALGEPEVNRLRALELIDQAVDRGAHWAIFPEMWTCGYDFKKLKDYTEGVNGPTITGLRKKAAETGIYIFAGSLPEKLSEGIYNTCFVIDPQGNILGKYSKIHLFGLMDEHKFLRPGAATCLVETPLGKVGVIICYDLRFPELARRLVLQGARVLVAPAQFPDPRAAHWRILNQARALENQVYVLAVNRVGNDKKNTFFGQSMAVDPWGEVVAAGGAEEEVVLVDLKPRLIDVVRRAMPCLKDRRPELY